MTQYIMTENNLGKEIAEKLSRDLLKQHLKKIKFDDEGAPKTSRNLVIYGDKDKLCIMMITTSAATWLALYNEDDLLKAIPLHSRAEMYKAMKTLIAMYAECMKENEEAVQYVRFPF